MSNKRKQMFDKDPICGFPVDERLAKKLKVSPSITVASMTNVLKNSYGVTLAEKYDKDTLIEIYTKICQGQSLDEAIGALENEASSVPMTTQQTSTNARVENGVHILPIDQSSARQTTPSFTQSSPMTMQRAKTTSSVPTAYHSRNQVTAPFNSQPLSVGPLRAPAARQSDRNGASVVLTERAVSMQRPQVPQQSTSQHTQQPQSDRKSRSSGNWWCWLGVALLFALCGSLYFFTRSDTTSLLQDLREHALEADKTIGISGALSNIAASLSALAARLTDPASWSFILFQSSDSALAVPVLAPTPAAATPKVTAAVEKDKAAKPPPAAATPPPAAAATAPGSAGDSHAAAKPPPAASGGDEPKHESKAADIPAAPAQQPPSAASGSASASPSPENNARPPPPPPPPPAEEKLQSPPPPPAAPAATGPEDAAETATADAAAAPAAPAAGTADPAATEQKARAAGDGTKKKKKGKGKGGASKKGDAAKKEM